MISAYLSLDRSRKRKVLSLLEEYCPSEDIFDAVLTTVEEFGDSADELREVLEGLENDRRVQAGLTINLFQILERRPHRRIDWRTVLRRRPKRYK